ncbi:MAG: DinB family protein [Gemmatimonadaceae bacterium]|nr:DinB family protein [Gemmatimonadaceae bacterium]
MLSELRRMRDHLAWADDALLDTIGNAPDFPTDAAREFAHILGADDTWLARIEGRRAGNGIWPALDLNGLRELALEVQVGYARHLDTLIEADLHRIVSYQNTAGILFETPVRDILYHVFLHAHYHRGKVNLLLRQAGLNPASVDYIGFIRGFPTAVTRI